MNNEIQNNKSDTFFLDIFNQILKYNEKNVMIIFDTNGGIWFKLTDLLRMLGYVDIKHTRNNIVINQQFIKVISEINEVVLKTTPPRFQPKTKFINEFGLYSLLTKSNKPVAKLFLQKYLIEIMPEIRKTGKYIVTNSEQTKINKLNEKIENYKTELNYYDNKYKFVTSPHGYIYINEDKQIKNGKKFPVIK